MSSARRAHLLALLASASTAASTACATPGSSADQVAPSAAPAPSHAPSARAPADAIPRCDGWGCTVHRVTPEVRATVLAAPHRLILALGDGKSQLESPPRQEPGAPWGGIVLPANTCITFESTATYEDIATIALLPETKALVLEPIGPGPLDLSPLTALHGLLRLKVDASLTSVAPLGSLPIESLFLNTTVSIGDPAPLGSLHSLRELTVFALPSLDAIAPLTGLQRLTVGGRSLASLKGLASLTQLRFLEVLSSAATDLAPVAALTELRSLRLDHTKITALPDLSALKNLSSLALRGDDLTDLAHLPKGLQTLALASNKRLKDLAPLASLTNLGSLDISDTAVTSLAPLASLKKLRSLQVSKDLPASEVDTLKKALPDLRVER